MPMQTRCALLVGLVAALGIPALTLAGDERCASRIGFTGGVHCGLDSDPSPPHPSQACTEAAIANLPQKCDPGWTRVIYDLDQPFPPDPTHPVSTVTIRASQFSACAAMPEKTLPMTGFAVGCWSPADKDGCRIVKFLNGGSMCLHIPHEPLGAGCSAECADVSTEQIAISTAGAADHFVCPPIDAAVSCRSQRSPNRTGRRKEKFRLWVGGFCATNGCEDPGGNPTVGPDTCVAGWGATYFGYAVGKSHPLGPGWYDWASGAFKVDYRNGKATCGTLGACIGAGQGNPWDLSIVGVPRSSTPPPCLSGAGRCNAARCGCIWPPETRRSLPTSR